MAKGQKYWDIRPIKKIPAQYRIIIGERSNGKTYGVLYDSIKNYIEHGHQFAYVRRWPEDIKTRKMQQVFEPLCVNGEITRLSNGKWNGVRFRYGKFYLIATDGEGQLVEDERPFAFTFAISAMEHDKSIEYPGIKRIIFEEFISRLSYIPDEFSLFMNLLSTLIRGRDDMEIWMLGNTVSKECPYFREMGLKHIYQQTPGTIDTYEYKAEDGDGTIHTMLIAVEYTKNLSSKKSDRYFIFDNPKVKMITGGAWELAIYPHLFENYMKNQIIFTFFINYREDTLLQCEVIEGKRGFFIYVHQKTTKLKELEEDLIYSPNPSSNPNHRTDITRPQYKIENKILELIRLERICFQDNEIGEVFNDYLKWCRSHQIIKS